MAGQATVAGVVPAKVAALTEGVMKSMMLTKLSKVVAGLVVLGVVVCGGGLLMHTTAAGQQTKSEQDGNKPAIGQSASPKGDAGTVAKNDIAKTDLDRLQGVWSVVSIEQGGQPAKLEKAVFMVDGKRACWQTSDFEMQGGLYLEPTGKPKTYDFVMSTRTMEGIYALEGDTLRLCYDIGTEPKRPGAFITAKGSQQVLIVLKRTHGPEVFPCILPDGTRAFPTVIEKKAKTPPPQTAPTPQTAPKPKDSLLGADFDAFQGEWTLEWMERDGKKLVDDMGRGLPPGTIKCVCKGKKWRLGELPPYSFEIDPSVSPKTIDIKILVDRRNMEDIYVKAEGIYKIEGNMVTWCFNVQEGGKRPTTFKTTPDSGLCMEAFKKVMTRPDEGAERMKGDMKRLQGAWTVVSIENPELTMAGKDAKQWSFIVQGNKLCFTEFYEVPYCPFELDETRQPKWLTFAEQKAIYRFDNDHLTIVLSGEGRRPTEFRIADDRPDVTIFVLKKETE